MKVMNEFKADKSLKNAKRVLKHKDSIVVQCVFSDLLNEAQTIVNAA